jgi:hypothetical protein
VRDRLASALNGQTEVRTPDGFIDILTSTEIIEVKTFNDWKHALGQVFVYSEHYPTHLMRVHLFDVEDPDLIKRLRSKFKRLNISLTFE